MAMEMESLKSPTRLLMLMMGTHYNYHSMYMTVGIHYRPIITGRVIQAEARQPIRAYLCGC